MIPRKYLVLAAMFGLLVSSDQLTKFSVTARQEPGVSRVLIPDLLNFTLVHNAGAAFGLLSELPESWRDPLFLLLPSITLLIILFFFTRLKDSQGISIYALAMIVGGAMGNLLDRLRLGYVIDFLDFHWRGGFHFPAFNVADAAITAGVLLMFTGLFLEKDKGEP